MERLGKWFGDWRKKDDVLVVLPGDEGKESCSNYETDKQSGGDNYPRADNRYSRPFLQPDQDDGFKLKRIFQVRMYPIARPWSSEDVSTTMDTKNEFSESSTSKIAPAPNKISSLFSMEKFKSLFSGGEKNSELSSSNSSSTTVPVVQNINPSTVASNQCDNKIDNNQSATPREKIVDDSVIGTENNDSAVDHPESSITQKRDCQYCRIIGSTVTMGGATYLLYEAYKNRSKHTGFVKFAFYGQCIFLSIALGLLSISTGFRIGPFKPLEEGETRSIEGLLKDDVKMFKDMLSRFTSTSSK